MLGVGAEALLAFGWVNTRSMIDCIWTLTRCILEVICGCQLSVSANCSP